MAVEGPVPDHPDRPHPVPPAPPQPPASALASASLARHSPSLQVGAPAHPHSPGTLRCYSAEELPWSHAPPHPAGSSCQWEQALPVALVSSLEAVGRRRRHIGAGTQCRAAAGRGAGEADVHQRSISPGDTGEGGLPGAWALSRGLPAGGSSSVRARGEAPMSQSSPRVSRRSQTWDTQGPLELFGPLSESLRGEMGPGGKRAGFHALGGHGA